MDVSFVFMCFASSNSVSNVVLFLYFPAYFTYSASEVQVWGECMAWLVNVNLLCLILCMCCLASALIIGFDRIMLLCLILYCFHFFFLVFFAFEIWGSIIALYTFFVFILCSGIFFLFCIMPRVGFCCSGSASFAV